MRAKDVMVTDFSVISTTTQVSEAVRFLRKNFGDESYMNAAPGLVVVNEKGELAGILSPLTVLRVLANQVNRDERPAQPSSGFYGELCNTLKGKLVEDIMDWQAISVTEDAELLEVADIFVEHRFQRIPVVKGKAVVGIIYRSRLLFALTECLLA
ncbi:MAG TPA: CBS domain-containing protein [Geobacteraceae bacterium]